MCLNIKNRTTYSRLSHRHLQTAWSQGSLSRGSPVNIFPSRLYLVSWALPPHQESHWSLCCCFVLWGERPRLPPCCSRCCCNYSVVWGIFGLTFCIPFASQGDWNKSKHYGLPHGKLIALDVYVLVLPSCIALFDHCWVAFDKVLCSRQFLCSFFFSFLFGCVRSCRKVCGNCFYSICRVKCLFCAGCWYTKAQFLCRCQ